MQQKIYQYIGIALLMLLLSSCEKEPAKVADNNQPDTSQIIISPDSVIVKGLYILNEGLFNMNNSSISYYDFTTGEYIADYFSQQNGRGLGDTGNDLQQYGSKLYCIVNVSSTIEVMTPDLKSIKRIAVVNDEGKARQPRKVAFEGGKAYITCFDGYVIRLDTASLEIDGICQVGLNPEGICIVGKRAYVCNSGGLNNPTYDNSVSVINLQSFTEEKKIEVVINPCVIVADNDRYVYAISRGNYGKIGYKLQRINTTTNEVEYAYDEEMLNLAIVGDYGIGYTYNYSNQKWKIKTFDPQTKQFSTSDFVGTTSGIQTPYALCIDTIGKRVFVADALNFTTNGTLYGFDWDGNRVFSLEAGLNPNTVFLITERIKKEE